MREAVGSSTADWLRTGAVRVERIGDAYRLAGLVIGGQRRCRGRGPGVILQDMTRPNPLLWIWYTFSGKLAPRYSEWVLRDVTCRTRWLRQTVRAVAQIAVPARPWCRLL